MKRKNHQAAFYHKIVAFVFVAVFFISVGTINGLCQNPTQNTDSISKNADEKIVKETVAKSVNPTLIVKADSEIKVVFDETAPGVVISSVP